LGVDEVLDKYPYQMSGGQRQRIACARALVTRPQLVLADEPTGALDSKNAKLLLESLDAINRAQKATVLMVTHDETAASFCRRVLFIRDGKVFCELVRGADTRREFFEKIMQVVAVQGGVDDAR
jgi:putative ABC transport system ATP-binding protein